MTARLGYKRRCGSAPGVRGGKKGAAARHQGNPFLFASLWDAASYLSRVSINNLMYEIIDAVELSARWNLPVTWIREYTRTRTKDTIPHLRLGHYVRFQWDSPELNQWLERHKNNGKGR